MFLRAATASALGVVVARPCLAMTSPSLYGTHLGFQAWTVRAQLTRSPEETIHRIAQIGYREMELYDPGQAGALVPIATANGIRVMGSHLPSLFPTVAEWNAWLVAGEPEVPIGYDLDRILATAQTYGLKMLGYASFAPEAAYGSERDYRAYVRLLDSIGARCRKQGISFIYHNHSREFASATTGSFFDIIVANTDPRHVAFEVDTCWAAQAGVKPAALIGRLGSRVRAIHLKDRTTVIAASPLTAMTEDPVRRIVAEVGRGELDIRGILAAAHRAGVRHVFVEQDYTPGDPVESLAESYRYVHGLGL